MRPEEARSFEEQHQVLDACDPEQVRAWATEYEVDEDRIREACGKVGGNRTAVELWLNAPQV